MAKVFASSLRDMKILTDKGLRVGRIFDMTVDETTGKIESIIVKPESQEIGQSLKSDTDGNAVIPFSSIIAVRDYIVVSEKSLAIQRMKSR